MTEDDYQELLKRANDLMDERDARVPPGDFPGKSTLDNAENDNSRPGVDTRIYPGHLYVSGNRVRVGPFGIYSNVSDSCFMVPTISGRPIISKGSTPALARPTLSRRYKGAAVYIESVFQLYFADDILTNPYRYWVPTDLGYEAHIADWIARGRFEGEETPKVLRAKFTRANIVDRALDSDYPIQKAEVSVTIPVGVNPHVSWNGSWSLTSSTAKSYALLGVYDRNGKVYNNIGGITPDPPPNVSEYAVMRLNDGRKIPSERLACLYIPIKDRKSTRLNSSH